MKQRRESVTHVAQGTFVYSANKADWLSTVLGSCVSVCLFDLKKGVGGMNHFLLEGGGGAEDLRYGAFAIEVLLNKMLRSGAVKQNVRAKAFGGARMFDYGVNIGANNVHFTTAFLKNEKIPIVSSDFGGTQARRVLFHPVTGTARVSLVPREAMDTVSAQPVLAKTGTITLFE